jgi:hypothetical protein
MTIHELVERSEVQRHNCGYDDQMTWKPRALTKHNASQEWPKGLAMHARVGLASARFWTKCHPNYQKPQLTSKKGYSQLWLDPCHSGGPFFQLCGGGCLV